MSSKYVDITSIIQVVGCIFNNPQLLDYSDKYKITEEDFTTDFHRIVFGSIYKLHELGAEKINLETIADFLSQRPKSEAIYRKEKGEEWLLKASDVALSSTFDYYYNRMKKMSLLRAYDNFGINVEDIYDPDNILDIKKKQLQEDYIDNASLEEIAEKVDSKVDEIKSQYLFDETSRSFQAGYGAQALFDRLKNHPDVGVPLFGPLINTVCRGARLKKYYVRSAPTGKGKSRTMIADACYIACNKIYDEQFGWIGNGVSEPTVYISTEQELEEVQTMLWAFLANVNEEHIKYNKYENDEEDRVKEAIRILNESPLYIVEMPDFSLRDVEGTIKKHIREYDVKYVFFDYIQTSPKIITEISSRSGGVKLREDNVLFMLSARLKDICNQYGVFIMSATQLNESWKVDDVPDQNLLRGAKSIADRADLGLIILPVTDKDKENLETLLSANTFSMPTIKISVYKNRSGRFTSMFLWCKADLGTCRVEPVFATDFGYNVIKINDLKIITEEAGAF